LRLVLANGRLKHPLSEGKALRPIALNLLKAVWFNVGTCLAVAMQLQSSQSEPVGFVPPPRNIADITAILDQEKLDPAKLADLTTKVQDCCFCHPRLVLGELDGLTQPALALTAPSDAKAQRSWGITSLQFATGPLSQRSWLVLQWLNEIQCGSSKNGNPCPAFRGEKQGLVRRVSIASL
jgi:hypothetical protein